MDAKNPSLLLREEGINPTEEVLKNALGKDLYFIYQQVINTLEASELDPQWRYYKDGKAWLCKIVYKKKTILWLSIWGDCIKTGFYFTEKHRQGVMDLDIDQKIKEVFAHTSPSGNLIALTVDIVQKEQLKDLKAIIDYKKSIS